MTAITRTPYSTGDIPTASEWNTQFDVVYNRVNTYDDGTGALYVLTSVAGNIQTAGNTISSVNANGDINITPNGIGNVVIDGSIWAYAEGLWTPEITGSTGAPSSITYTSQLGRYTRIGNQCFLQVEVQVSGSITGGSGNLRVINLPFTIVNASSYEAYGTVQYNGLNVDAATVDVVAKFSGNTTYIEFVENKDNSVASACSIGDLGSSGKLVISAVFEIED